jgi:hypothetical protein
MSIRHKQLRPLKVSTDGTAGPYIIVEPDQVDAVRTTLNANRWPNVISGNTWSQGMPDSTVIDLGSEADVAAVQLALDKM